MHQLQRKVIIQKTDLFGIRAFQLGRTQNDTKGINRAWENIKENIKTSATDSPGPYELKHHKPSLDEECSSFLYQRKQAEMQWLQNPNQSNVDNLNNVRHEASRHFRNKKKEYQRAKINELETNSKIKSIRLVQWHKRLQEGSLA